MQSTRTRAMFVLFAFLLVPNLIACELKQVTVKLPDFETSAIQGVRLWRLVGDSSQFEADDHIMFSEVYENDGEEWVDYTIVRSEGDERPALPVRVERDPADPSAVTLALFFYGSVEQSWFRVSAFNAAGESPMSEEEIYL